VEFDEFRSELLAACGRAASLLDLDDAECEEQFWDLRDERTHCGTCTVRTVMDEVWPSIEKYLLSLGVDF
jgi:hypothetical protein